MTSTAATGSTWKVINAVTPFRYSGHGPAREQQERDRPERERPEREHQEKELKEKGLTDKELKEREHRENHQAIRRPKAPTYLLRDPQVSPLLSLPTRMGLSQTAQAVTSELMTRPR